MIGNENLLEQPSRRVFLRAGLLGTVARRVGSLEDEDYEAIFASRRNWLAGV